MKTYQLKFLAWTFSAFLPPNDPDAEAENEVDYYELLDVAIDANSDDIKKAYRKRSLQLHPDKLRQRGMRYQGDTITDDEARARFQQMKAAYDTLSDPKKRQIYDALGHRGMDFLINPSHAYDPHILLGNLAKSSVLDRAKLMALVLIFFGLVLLQPIVLCAKVDQMLGKQDGDLINASWLALLFPFWIYSMFYGVLLIIGKAVLPLLQWISFVVAILFLTLKFDNVLPWDYAILFTPFYVWMFLRFVEAQRERWSVQADMARMVTIEFIEKFIINEKEQDEDGHYVEDQLHRTYNDLEEEERDDINKEYIIVHVPPKASSPGEDEEDQEDDFEQIERSPEYQEAKARHEYASKSIQRILIPEIPLIVLVIVQLDQNKTWNWGFTFLPLWISMFFECCGGCYGCFCTSFLAHIEVQEAMAHHCAKEQEAKKNDDGKDTDEEKGEIGKTEGGRGTQTNKSTESEISDAASGANEGNSEKPSREDQAKIDTAVIVEPSVKTETTKAESQADKAKGKAEVPEDGNDNGDFFFTMDEETFLFYQQAEQEAENKATEAQSNAISSFCSIIFQTIIAALFVVKLNLTNEESTSSFSSFWILFPFFLISGCIVSCFAIAIFGAASIDTAMAADEPNENGDDSGGEQAVQANNNEASQITMIPPPQQVFEDMAGKNDEVVVQASNIEEHAGDGSAPAEAVETDQESAMDDLD